METVNLGKKLPPGFRFHPTDEELVIQYLKRKVNSFPLPASIIPELEVCNYEPWDMHSGKEEEEEERYFFSSREAKRSTVSGYWKATGKDKPIVVRNGVVVGMKKTLVFYRGRGRSHASRTHWIMHEYRLPHNTNHAHAQLQQAKGDWVLCRIFQKKRKNFAKEKDECSSRMMKKREFFNIPAAASSSSSSGSSALTQLSSNTNHQELEETSSCGNTFSSIRPKP